MKKRYWLLAAALAVLVMLPFLMPDQENTDTVRFYYARKTYGFGEKSGTIGYEDRNVGKRSKDLPYLLALYLEGPLNSDFRIPFPGRNIDQVQTVELADGVATITLADMGVGMTDSQFCLSCAALSKTCIELTNAEAVKISSGERSVTMDLNNILLYDDSTSVERTDQED